MLLYGAARDPATCKPTKDSEIAAARPALSYARPSPPSVSRPCLLHSPSHPATRSRSFSLSSPAWRPSPRRSENTASQYRNVFTAIQSRRQNLARSSGKVAEVAVAIFVALDLPCRERRFLFWILRCYPASRRRRAAAIAIAGPAYRGKPGIDSRQRSGSVSLPSYHFRLFSLSRG